MNKCEQKCDGVPFGLRRSPSFCTNCRVNVDSDPVCVTSVTAGERVCERFYAENAQKRNCSCVLSLSQK